MWVSALAGPAGASGQTPVEGLWSACAIDVPGVPGLCADGALALQALHAGIGGLMTAGGSLPVGPSTLGHRTEGSPRISVELGAGWSSFRHPDLSRAPSSGGGNETRSNLLSGRLTGIVGVFPGFSPAPTVGGVLSLDAVVMVQAVSLPDSPVSPGTRFGWGIGARVGVFRESFSLPGVTLSGMYHSLGRVLYGREDGPGALASLDPSVTSFRLTVGKELWPIGVAGGMGWDRYRGDGGIRAQATEGTPTVSSGPRDLDTDRRYIFAGASYTWLVAQIAGEVAWAGSASPTVELEGSRGFDPGGTELQGSFTFRIRY